MEEGHKVIGNKKDGLSVKKGGRVITFDIRVETPKGVLWCTYIWRHESKGEVTAIMSDARGDNQPNKSMRLIPAIKWALSKLMQSWDMQARERHGKQQQHPAFSSQEVHSRPASHVQLQKWSIRLWMMKARECNQSSTTGEFTIKLQLSKKEWKTSLLVEEQCGTSRPKKQWTSREANSLWRKATCQRICAFLCNERSHVGIQSWSSGRTTPARTRSWSRWLIHKNGSWNLFLRTLLKKSQQNSYVELAFTVIALKTRAMMNAVQIPKSEHFKL